MSEETEDIEGDIEDEREELRSNLEELGDRVRSVADWRQQFRHRPLAGLAVAFGGGLILAGLMRRAPRGRVYRLETGAASGRRRQLDNAWEAVQSALIGVLASRLSGTLADLVPAFADRFTGKGAARRRGSGNGVQGEGNYRAARRYRSGAERFARTADVARAAREAAPGTASEAEALADAEQAGRARGKPS